MITGTVYDASTRETLPNADVYFSDEAGTTQSATGGTATDKNGKFTFPDYSQAGGRGRGIINTSFPTVYLTASYTGYARQTKKVSSASNVDFYLTPQATELPEVTITATANESTNIVKTATNKVLIYAVGGALALALTLFIFIKRRK